MPVFSSLPTLSSAIQLLFFRTLSSFWSWHVAFLTLAVCWKVCFSLSSFLHFSVTLSILGSNTFINTMFSNSVNLCSQVVNYCLVTVEAWVQPGHSLCVVYDAQSERCFFGDNLAFLCQLRCHEYFYTGLWLGTVMVGTFGITDQGTQSDPLWQHHRGNWLSVKMKIFSS